MKHLPRLGILVVVFIFCNSLVHAVYDVKGIRNKALSGNTFLNLTDVATIDQCLAMCLQHCQCISFQLCQQGCQLCSTTKDLTPSAFTEADGCVHYSFKKVQLANGQSQQQCQTDINCCAASNPCQNNGLCEPSGIACQPTRERRFRCVCPYGYTGELCEQPIRSCRAYNDGNRVAGKYEVFDDHMVPFEVFCDFDPDSGLAWTVIQSYQLAKNDVLGTWSFDRDEPLNEDTPNWDFYRLSHARMLSIQEDSSKWRITCRYDTDGLNYTDYIRCSNDKVNILTPKTELDCEEVEYINIRGYNCTACTAEVIVFRRKQVHVGSYSSDCTLKPQEAQSCEDNFDIDNDMSEYNFGFYQCYNPRHRCSSSQDSTTQTWFGGQ